MKNLLFAVYGLCMNIYIFSQPVIRIDKTSESNSIFNPKLHGSLMNILLNNKSQLEDYEFETMFGNIQDATLNQFNLDKSDFLEFKKKNMMFITRVISEDEWIVQRSGSSFDIWLDSLLNDPNILRDPVIGFSEYEELGRIHQINPQRLRKSWDSTCDGCALYNYWSSYSSVSNIDYMLLEPNTCVHFIKNTKDGDLCTYELNLPPFNNENWQFEIDNELSGSDIRKLLSLAKKEYKNQPRLDWDIDYIDVQVEPIVSTLNSSDSLIPIIADLSDKNNSNIKWKASGLSYPYEFFRENSYDNWLPIRTNQTLYNWMDSLLHSPNFIDPNSELSDYDQIGRVYLQDSLTLINGWNQAKPGEPILHHSKEKPIWVELGKPGVKLFISIDSLGIDISKIIFTDQINGQTVYFMEFSDEKGNLSETLKKAIKYRKLEFTENYQNWYSFLNSNYVPNSYLPDYKLLNH